MQILNSWLRSNKILFIILLLGFLLRFIGLKPGYPTNHPDEDLSYGSAGAMILNNNIDPLRYDYPSLTALIDAVVFRGFFIPISTLKEFVSAPAGFIRAYVIEGQPFKILYGKIAGPRSVNALYWARYINAFIGFISIPLLYLLGKKMFSRRVGLIAAALLAVNYRHVLGSHIALTDVVNAFFTLAAVYIIYILSVQGRKNWYILAGGAIGLTLSVKYQFFVVFAFLLANFYLFLQNPSSFKSILKKSFLSGIIAIVVFVSLNPYHLLKWQETRHWVTSSMHRYGAGMNRFMFFPYTYLFRIDIGILPSVFFFFGFLIGLFKYFKKTLLLLAIIIPIFFVFTYYSNGGGFLRNFIPAIPFIIVISALGIDWASNLLNIKFSQTKVIFALTIIVMTFPLYDSLVLALEYSHPHVERLVNEYIANNLPSGVKVITIPPIVFPEEGNFKIIDDGYKPDNIFNLAEAADENIDIAVIELGGIYNYMYWWTGKAWEEILPYWDNPGKYHENTLPGLSILDLARRADVFIAKQSQALDYKYVIASVPKLATPSAQTTKEIVGYKFEKGINWIVAGGKTIPRNNYLYDSDEGRSSKGSLKILPGQKNSEVARIKSIPIEIQPLRKYHLLGWVKTDRKLNKEKRDAFFRLDFYPNKHSAQSEQTGERVALSSRVYGENWVKKEISAISPSTAAYVTITFQVPNFRNGPTYWIDDILLSEGERVILTQKQRRREYIEKKIKQSYIFPLSL